jgi:hypothetical protein
MTADNSQGSLAAAFQGRAYRAFTPAGGIFANLTTTVLKMIVANGGEARWSSYQPNLVSSRP